VEPKELVAIGVVAVGGIAILVYVASQKSTSTSYAVDPNAAATENAIIGANTTANNTQASEVLGLAQLATGYETSANNNATTVAVTNANDATSQTLGLAQLATDYETTHDANQTNLALANVAGATNVSLGKIAAASTYQSALLDTASKIESTLSTAQTAQYTSYVTGQTALAGDAATTTDVGLQTAASQAIAGIQGTAQTATAKYNAQSQTAIGQAEAAAATTISNNQTTAAVNAADRAASASKSNGFWAGLSGIAGSVASFFSPTSSSGLDTYTIDGSGNLVDSSSVTTPAIGAGGPVAVPAYTPTNFGLPTLVGS
jgi:hypothetical protein